MSARRLLAPALLLSLSLLSTPAWAVFCPIEGPIIAYEFDNEGGRSDRLVINKARQNAYDRKRLLEIGVPAESVERWNGCLKAIVQQPDGRRINEFYDPNTLQRLQ